MTNQERINLIQQKLNEALSPETLEVIDNSAEHAGHAGAQSGAGHFTVNIVSNAFVGKSMPAQHRLVYDALADMMKEEIHALCIHAKVPG